MGFTTLSFKELELLTKKRKKIIQSQTVKDKLLMSAQHDENASCVDSNVLESETVNVEAEESTLDLSKFFSKEMVKTAFEKIEDSIKNRELTVPIIMECTQKDIVDLADNEYKLKLLHKMAFIAAVKKLQNLEMQKRERLRMHVNIRNKNNSDEQRLNGNEKIDYTEKEKQVLGNIDKLREKIENTRKKTVQQRKQQSEKIKTDILKIDEISKELHTKLDEIIARFKVKIRDELKNDKAKHTVMESDFDKEDKKLDILQRKFENFVKSENINKEHGGKRKGKWKGDRNLNDEEYDIKIDTYMIDVETRGSMINDLIEQSEWVVSSSIMLDTNNINMTSICQSIDQYLNSSIVINHSNSHNSHNSNNSKKTTNKHSDDNSNNNNNNHYTGSSWDTNVNATMNSINSVYSGSSEEVYINRMRNYQQSEDSEQSLRVNLDSECKENSNINWQWDYCNESGLFNWTKHIVNNKKTFECSKKNFDCCCFGRCNTGMRPNSGIYSLRLRIEEIGNRQTLCNMIGITCNTDDNNNYHFKHHYWYYSKEYIGWSSYDSNSSQLKQSEQEQVKQYLPFGLICGNSICQKDNIFYNTIKYKNHYKEYKNSLPCLRSGDTITLKYNSDRGVLQVGKEFAKSTHAVMASLKKLPKNRVFYWMVGHAHNPMRVTILD